MVAAPLHIEVLSEDPPVLMFHDFITDEEIKSMKFSIMAEMKVSTVQDLNSKDGGGTKTSNERTQASGWLWDEEDEILYAMSKRISKATKLIANKENLDDQSYFEAAEPWQVGVYSPGGHYLPHYDDFEILDPQSYTRDGTWVGNRIATAMAYLSDVEGGFTAFPNIGIAAQPQKGSVVFWYSLYPEGVRDHRGLHGACPTIHGIKWVSNKWIREGAQIWSYPCIP